MRLRHPRLHVHSLLRASVWKRTAHAAASAPVGAAVRAASSAAQRAAEHAAAVATATRRTAQRGPRLLDLVWRQSRRVPRVLWLHRLVLHGRSPDMVN